MAQTASKGSLAFRLHSVPMTAEEYIAPVERTVEQLLIEIEQLPTDVLYREPAPGEWPVMSTLAHLAELLPYWAHEAADIARSPGKPVGRTHDDPRRLGAIEQHGNDSLADIVPRIRAGLDECKTTLRSIPEEGWNAVGQHIRRGDVTAAELVKAFVVSHAEEHAAQVHATLGTLRAAKA
jgi:uncharacterized damage-inducible protein DinB